jgi:hypothetical protein
MENYARLFRMVTSSDKMKYLITDAWHQVT